MARTQPRPAGVAGRARQFRVLARDLETREVYHLPVTGWEVRVPNPFDLRFFAHEPVSATITDNVILSEYTTGMGASSGSSVAAAVRRMEDALAAGGGWSDFARLVTERVAEHGRANGEEVIS